MLSPVDTSIFDTIHVDGNTISYEAPEGFDLNMNRVHSDAAILLAPACGGDVDLAAKHAVYQQIVEHWREICG